MYMLYSIPTIITMIRTTPIATLIPVLAKRPRVSLSQDWHILNLSTSTSSAAATSAAATSPSAETSATTTIPASAPSRPSTNNSTVPAAPSSPPSNQSKKHYETDYK